MSAERKRLQQRLLYSVLYSTVGGWLHSAAPLGGDAPLGGPNLSPGTVQYSTVRDDAVDDL